MSTSARSRTRWQTGADASWRVREYPLRDDPVGADPDARPRSRGAFSPDGTLQPQAVQQVVRVLYAQPQGMDYDSLEPTRLYTTRLLPT